MAEYTQLSKKLEEFKSFYNSDLNDLLQKKDKLAEVLTDVSKNVEQSKEEYSSAAEDENSKKITESLTLTHGGVERIKERASKDIEIFSNNCERLYNFLENYDKLVNDGKDKESKVTSDKEDEKEKEKDINDKKDKIVASVNKNIDVINSDGEKMLDMIVKGMDNVDFGIIGNMHVGGSLKEAVPYDSVSFSIIGAIAAAWAKIKMNDFANSVGDAVTAIGNLPPKGEDGENPAKETDEEETKNVKKEDLPVDIVEKNKEDLKKILMSEGMNEQEANHTIAYIESQGGDKAVADVLYERQKNQLIVKLMESGMTREEAEKYVTDMGIFKSRSEIASLIDEADSAASDKTKTEASEDSAGEEALAAASENKDDEEETESSEDSSDEEETETSEDSEDAEKQTGKNRQENGGMSTSSGDVNKDETQGTSLEDSVGEEETESSEDSEDAETPIEFNVDEHERLTGEMLEDKEMQIGEKITVYDKNGVEYEIKRTKIGYTITNKSDNTEQIILSPYYLDRSYATEFYY